MQYLKKIQNHIIQHLHNDPSLKVMINGIYSHVPQNAKYPFIKIANLDMKVAQMVSSKIHQYQIIIEVLSSSSNNIECLNIIERLDYVISDMNMQLSDKNHSFTGPYILNSGIRQLPNLVWQGQVTVLVHGALLN